MAFGVTPRTLSVRVSKSFFPNKNTMLLQNVARKIFGTQNDRELKSIRPLVDQISRLEATIKPLSDSQLQAKTAEFRQRLAAGATVDSILPEAFAVVREAAWRVIGQRHYDVQMIGGITLHRGRIAEMRTGEGKTLVATLPAYLNALEGKGVHVITVNDYLARRDSSWMGQVHRFLGLSTGVIVHGLTDQQRKQNYGCDITYGTNNEFGFDYLRDNMKFRLEDYVQRELHFAIVDEVDSILIDEARTPLIISGPTDETTDLYQKIDRQILSDGGVTKDIDYTVDEKSKTASLTEAGVEKMEKRLGLANLYDPAHIELLHHVNQGLRAHVLFHRDVDYVIRDGEVMIVDEFTGRLMPGRRWSDGLHQAIEAKEGVEIQNENQTLATITFQNYFRMYKKLGGMTGTADTEATEFKQIYKLDVTVAPTNRPMIRLDEADLIYKSEAGKFKSILEDLREKKSRGQPVLVGTVSVEKSERLSALLSKEGITHNVLNAKQHEREAEVIAQAGRKGSITIATNMAGRGTDILLGGDAEKLARAQVGPVKSDWTDEERTEHHKKYEETFESLKQICEGEREEVKKLGGLFILGTERHESRRIDNQLRGRAGRQGDPGGSRFYLSLDDDLMRIFGGVNIARFMEEDLPIEHRWINKAIENAQRKVEGHNYDIRKHLLEYDDVMNQQRKVVYAWRREVLGRENLRDMIFSMVEELAGAIAADFFPGGRLKKVNGHPFLDAKELNDAVTVMLQLSSHITEKDIHPFSDKGLQQLLVKMAEKAYSEKENALGADTIRQIEKMILLTTIDHLWKDHLLAMDHLREGVGLQGYGQKDPLIIYKKEGFRFFQMMMSQITGDVVRKIFAVQFAPSRDLDEEIEHELEAEEALMHPQQKMQYNLSTDGALVPQSASGPQKPTGGQPARAAFNADEQLRTRQQRQQQNMSMGRGMQLSAAGAGGAHADLLSARAQNVSPSPGGEFDKVGRNDPCPCGSGKKFKKCHGMN